MLRMLVVVIAGCGRIGFDATSDARVDGATTMSDGGRVFPAGLVAWWPLDDDPSDGSTPDASGHGHTASCAACPTAVAGRIDGGFDFNPALTDLFRVSDDGSFALTGGFTVANWIYLRSNVTFTSFSKAVGAASGDSWEMGAYSAGTHAFNTGDPPDVDQASAIPLNQWIHVAGTWDVTGAKRLFVNGQLVSTWSPRSNSFDGHDVLIGGEEDAGGNGTFYHEGLLDDVQVYSRALSDVEIATLAQP